MSRRSVFQRLCGSVCAIAAVVAVAGDGSSSLVGKTLPPYPAGLDELQGSCIPGGPSLERICDYSLQLIGKPANDTVAGVPAQVVALRNIDPDAAQPRWRVLDATPVPKPRRGYALQIGTCRIDGKDNQGVVAFVRHSHREYSRDVRWARQFDIASGKLMPLAIKRVDCVNEALGV